MLGALAVAIIKPHGSRAIGLEANIGAEAFALFSSRPELVSVGADGRA
jgi:hypothetical protein